MDFSETGIYQSRSVESLPFERVSVLLILIILNYFKNAVKSDNAEWNSAVERYSFSKRAYVSKEENYQLQGFCKLYFFPYSSKDTSFQRNSWELQLM